MRARSLGPDLCECPARAKPREVQRRVGARDHHQPRRRGQVVEREIDRVEAFEIGDALEVVEHESERGAKRRDAVRQLDDRALDDCSGSLQPPQRTAAKAAAHSFDRHRRVGPEPHRGRCRRPRASPRRRSRSASPTTCGRQRSSRNPAEPLTSVERHLVPLAEPPALAGARPSRGAASAGSSFVSADGSASNSTGGVIGGLVRTSSRDVHAAEGAMRQVAGSPKRNVDRARAEPTHPARSPSHRTPGL